MKTQASEYGTEIKTTTSYVVKILAPEAAVYMEADENSPVKYIGKRGQVYEAEGKRQQGWVQLTGGGKVFRGAGSVGSAGYVPRTSLYYSPDCVEYDYDPDAARAVLADKNLSVTLLAADSGSDVAIAELIKIDLEAAGVAVTVESYDSATRDSMVNAGDYQFALVGNGGWGNNPPTYLRTIFSDISKNQGGNPHSMGPIGYENAQITELAEAQKLETDFEARKAIFQELQVLISQEIPLIVIANQSSYSMYRKDVYDGWMKTYAYQQAEQNRLSYMLR